MNTVLKLTYTGFIWKIEDLFDLITEYNCTTVFLLGRIGIYSNQNYFYFLEGSGYAPIKIALFWRIGKGFDKKNYYSIFPELHEEAFRPAKFIFFKIFKYCIYKILTKRLIFLSHIVVSIWDFNYINCTYFLYYLDIILLQILLYITRLFYWRS